ncbi:MAG: RNA polymerase sigma factor [Bacteroidales bacterium]
MNNEKQLLEGINKGSYKDFKQLYEYYIPILRPFVFGLLKSESKTKDILQETFIKVWVNRSQIDPTLSFKSYLFKIAHNQVIDDFRRKMSNPLFEDYLLYCESPELSDIPTEIELDYDEFIIRLERAKVKLQPRQREIFELSKEHGLSAKEIALRINVTEQSIYNQLSLSLQIIRQEMGPYLPLFLIFFS